MLAALLGTCASLQEQITSARLEYFPRLTKFELVSLLVGLVWKTNMESFDTKALYLFPVARNHSPLIGITDTDEFQTSTSVALGPKFWDLCL